MLPQWIRETFPLLVRDDGNIISELSTYLGESLGNRGRIDYGTGHELSFLAFLTSFHVLRPMGREELQDSGLNVMAVYLGLVRRLQIEYSLEPAGSHGVWGLDDYQFIPFLWGSAQLIDTDYLPSSIADPAMVGTLRKDYHYYEAIHFICRLKKATHFGEHSPLLYDISALPGWEKINSGLIKMYKTEVLHRFPVVQHFLFGSILSFESRTTKDEPSPLMPLKE